MTATLRRAPTYRAVSSVFLFQDLELSASSFEAAQVELGTTRSERVGLREARVTPDSFIAVAVPEWMGRARCADPQYAHLDFFPNTGRGRPTSLSVTRCKDVCAGCPVWAECLDDAMASEGHSTTYGIRGGLTVEERKAIRKMQNDRRPNVPTVVYFARRLDRIKIGFSSNIEARMKALGCTLLASTAGGRDEERQMHERFAAGRVSGEWFRPTADLLGFIADLRSGELAA